jgi:hypothetical protein
MESTEFDLTSLAADIVSAYVAIMRLAVTNFLISSALSMAL